MKTYKNVMMIDYYSLQDVLGVSASPDNTAVIHDVSIVSESPVISEEKWGEKMIRAYNLTLNANSGFENECRPNECRPITSPNPPKWPIQNLNTRGTRHYVRIISMLIHVQETSGNKQTNKKRPLLLQTYFCVDHALHMILDLSYDI